MAHRVRSLSLVLGLATAFSLHALPADAGRRNPTSSVVGTTSQPRQPVPAVPEPGAIAVFALGAAVTALAVRRMRRRD
jgi:hypothetical protein